MARLFVIFLAGMVLSAAAVWAQPGQELMLELDLAGQPGVPPGVSGQIYVPVPFAPPPALLPAPPVAAGHVLRRPPGDVLHGPPGDVLAGPPGDPLTGAPALSRAGP